MPGRLRRPRLPMALLRARGGATAALLRDRRGATAVEFGMVAVPFLVVVLGIFELALIFLVSGTLDTATAAAARESGMLADRPTPAAMAERICDAMPVFGRDCATALTVDVSDLGTSAGQSDIVVIRAVYDWPLISPLVGRALPGRAGRLSFVATSAFRPDVS